MLRSLHRRLVYLAFGLGALAVLPLTGAVNAQNGRFRTGFPTYVPPGQLRPPLGAGMLGQGGGAAGVNGQIQGGVQGIGGQIQGGVQGIGGGFNIGGGIGGIGGGGFNIGGGIGGGFNIGGGKIGFSGEYGN